MNRYITKISFYTYANSDEEAIEQAHKEAAMQHKKNDDYCEVIAVHNVPFGELVGKQIYPKN